MNTNWVKVYEKEIDDLKSRGMLFNGTDSVSRCEAKNVGKSILDRQEDELRNIYENCPQCEGLRNEYIEELREKIKGAWPKNHWEDALSLDDVLEIIKK